ncbi:conserved hypothetical protein [Xylanimonas cellulosilytica DSM 15894]|uniref:PIN domain-containing protein n=1 Tax=Xylanimonas cellulosilytica (strain DSM 15894 / JCM 12276 / CECT 5975 / KCTC 9989 / LMG 20990 / NBRC 107835 / XIL07) TaxID=446471 RepID=D1BY38_XYLCX|nr:PIN domain-containing protein [Xylanimonas cellulosilytica]ACZ29881.1 conserved hypothetical protein [Xylanimonas cellulosilytica DSM 15894]
MTHRHPGGIPGPAPIRVVLTDANILYSRVLRDYVLYAASIQLISVAWSQRVLDEMSRHLRAKVDGFTQESAHVLETAMTRTFPYALTTITPDAEAALAGIPLPDGDDRHVLEAAVAADASILCTSNTKDFPTPVTDALGIEVLTQDELLTRLVHDHPDAMVAVHRLVVDAMRNATDESRLEALRRANAPGAANALARLLE